MVHRQILAYCSRLTGLTYATTASPLRQVTVFALYSMAIRHVLSTIGQPLRSAMTRRVDLIAAVNAERAASNLSEGLGEGVVGPAAEAAAQEALEAMPFPYMPSVGALLLMFVAVAAHTLLLLGKRWSVRFYAW